MQGIPNPTSRVPAWSPCTSQDTTGMMGTNFSSTAPIPVMKVPMPRTHPKHRREVLVDGRDKCGQVDIVQAAAGISQVGLRAEFKWVDCAVVNEAQLGGLICFLCISFTGLGLHELSIFAPGAHGEILFGKINIIFPYCCVKKAVYSSSWRKKKTRQKPTCAWFCKNLMELVLLENLCFPSNRRKLVRVPAVSVNKSLETGIRNDGGKTAVSCISSKEMKQNLISKSLWTILGI